MKPIPKIAWLLGYAGLIPFTCLTLLMLIENYSTVAIELPLAWWQASYAAIILSFLGAVSWGVALGMHGQLHKSDIDRLLIYSVMPSILAWFTLIFASNVSLFVLAELVILAYIIDAFILFPKIKSQYAVLRLHLTVGVVLNLSFSAIAVL